MAATSKSSSDGLLKSVAVAHLILVLHVFLLAGLGLLVLFFSGIVRYMFWIFIIGAFGVGISAYLFYRRMKREGKTLTELLRTSGFEGRSVEIGVLGGLITLKLGAAATMAAIDNGGNQPKQLEDPEILNIRELAALGQLLEKELITLEEFERAKQRLMQNRR